MKEPRVEKIVAELKATVDRLNRLNGILAQSGTTFHLSRSTRDGPFKLEDIRQEVNYE